jgi:hypothetical protein
MVEVGTYITWRFDLHILRLFGIFCGHWVYFMVVLYIFPRFGMLYQEKSGNPDQNIFLLTNLKQSLCDSYKPIFPS